jgi:hypothetical protein
MKFNFYFPGKILSQPFRLLKKQVDLQGAMPLAQIYKPFGLIVSEKIYLIIRNEFLKLLYRLKA